MRSANLVRAYQRVRLLRKAMLATFVVLTASAAVWVFPWLPVGLRSGDYTGQLAIAAVLGTGAWLSAFGLVYLRDKSNRYEQTLAGQNAAHDTLGGHYTSEHFFERLIMECTRSERTQTPFGVFTLQAGPKYPGSGDALANMREVIGGLTRQSDSMATLGPNELGVLGTGMGRREAPAFAYRLKSRLESTKNTEVSDKQAGDLVSVGWAIWGVDGQDAGALLAAARARMQRKAAVEELGRSFGDSTGPEHDANRDAAPDESSTIVDLASRAKRRG